MKLAACEPGVSIDYPDRFQDREINGRPYVPGRPAGDALRTRASVSIDVLRVAAGLRMPAAAGPR